MITISNNTFPCFYTLADQQAIESQEQYLSTLRASMELIIAASLLTYLQRFFELNYVELLVSILLLFNLILNWWIQSTKKDNLWYDYRSIAESIKTLTWKYMLKVSPFAGTESGSTKEFRKRVTKILNDNKILLQKSKAIPAHKQFITNDMRNIRACDLKTRGLIYDKYRVQDQAEWYAKKSEYNNKMGKRFFGIYLLLNILLLIFIISNYKLSRNYVPLDLLMVLLTNIQTWTQTKKYSDLANSYALASQEIALIKEETTSFRTEQEFSQYVSNCENAFSREHTQWYARKQ